MAKTVWGVGDILTSLWANLIGSHVHDGVDADGHVNKIDLTSHVAGVLPTANQAPPTEATLSLADNTTNDVTTSKHGFAPKAPNDATKYLDGTGNYSVPASSSTGEANTASNVGSTGVGIYDSKAGVDLRFKKLAVGSAKLTVTDGGSAQPVSLDVAEGQIAHQNLSGAGTNTHAQVDSFIASKGAVNGLPTLNSSSLVVQNPANATATPTASKIPISDGTGKVASGWIPDLSASYITNAQKAAASGVASLNSSGLVVQAPAISTSSPAASSIPVSDGSGTLNSWVTVPGNGTNKITWAGSPPTAATQGDICINTGALAGGWMCWICVASGNPATWQVAGQINPPPPPPPSGTGNSYYMSLTGNDSNAGTLAAPWATLNKAFSVMVAGDTLFIRAGTYTGQGSASTRTIANGTATQPITIRNYPGETAKFDGVSKTFEFLVIANTSYFVIDGLEIYNHLEAVHAYYSYDYLTIQNCYVHDNGTDVNGHHGLYFQSNYPTNPGGTGVVVRNNRITTSASAGIHCWHGNCINGMKVYNNLITGNKVGFLAGDNAQNIDFYNNTVDGNQYGLDLHQDGQNLTTGVPGFVMKNNIISNSTNYSIMISATNETNITGDYDLFYNNNHEVQWAGVDKTLAQYKTLSSQEAHSIASNPLFVSGSDWHSQAGSPAVNAGVTLADVATDKDGVSRPQGSAYDIGCYER